jgi:hypothetical protein
MLALLGSSLAFIFITVSIRELGISRTTIFTNIIPVITAIAAYFMLGVTVSRKERSSEWPSSSQVYSCLNSRNEKAPRLSMSGDYSAQGNSLFMVPA